MKHIFSFTFIFSLFLFTNYAMAQKNVEKIFDKAITEISCETAKFMILRTNDPKPEVCKCDSNVYVLLESIKQTYPSAFSLITKSKEGHTVNGVSIEKDTAAIHKLILSQIQQLKILNKTLKKYKPSEIDDLESSLFEVLEKATKEAENIQKSQKEKISEKNVVNNKKENKNKQNSNSNGYSIDWTKTFLVFLVVILLIIVAFLFFQNLQFKKIYKNTSNLTNLQSTTNTTKPHIQSNSQTTTIPIVPQVNQPTSKTNFNHSNKSWFVVGESVIGLGHIKSSPPIPCQDNHHYEMIGNNWGIAITSDGAGSAKLSQKGSEYVAKFAALKLFKDLVVNSNWNSQNILPSDEIWKKNAKEQLMNLRVALGEYAKKLNVNLKDLACTVIIVIYSPKGLLVTHIGDGRAGYCNDRNEWKSMIKPWKGEEANATVFITSDIWGNDIDSYIESRVIRENVSAFTLMSDGCEQASFECSIVEKGSQKWSDPNLPYIKFFNPLVETIIGFKQDNISPIEAKAKWKKFLESGNQKLAEEQDDKTMILGVLA